MPTPEEIKAAADAEAAAAAAQGGAGPDDPTKGKGDGQGSEADSQVEEIVMDVNDVEVDNDGNLIWKADPTDPDTTVYMGKDLAELHENIRKGTKEKDAYIRKLRAAEKTRLADEPARGTEGDEGEADPNEPAPPDREAIIRDTFQKQGVDLRMARWSDEDWIKWGDDNNKRDFQIAKAQEYVQSLVKSAVTEYEDRTVRWTNHRILMSETKRVTELLEDFGVDDGFDYDALLSKIYEDPKNFTNYGKLEEGVVTAAAAKEIRRLSNARTRTKLEQRIEEDIAKGDKAKSGVRGTSTVKEPAKKTSPVPKTQEESLQQSLAEWNAAHPSR